MQLDLGIVIVNWNTRDLLRDCLTSLHTGDPTVRRRVIVVDNASTDGSLEMVQAEFPRVEAVANPVNGGFSQANNIGLRLLGFRDRAEADGTAPDTTLPDQLPRYTLLLNPDTVVPPDGLRRMIARLDAEPTLGAAGPRLVMLDGKLDLACRRSFPTPEVMLWRVMGLSKLFPRSKLFGRYNMTYLNEHVETEVDCVVGAFMMVRREAIQQAGLLDEQFWMYGEDIDWAYRIKQAGWRILYYPSVTVLHVKRAASRMNPRTKLEFERAGWLFYRKHYASSTPKPLHWAVLLGMVLRGGLPLWKEIKLDVT